MDGTANQYFAIPSILKQTNALCICECLKLSNQYSKNIKVKEDRFFFLDTPRKLGIHALKYHAVQKGEKVKFVDG